MPAYGLVSVRVVDELQADDLERCGLDLCRGCWHAFGHAKMRF